MFCVWSSRVSERFPPSVPFPVFVSLTPKESTRCQQGSEACAVPSFFGLSGWNQMRALIPSRLQEPRGTYQLSLSRGDMVWAIGLGKAGSPIFDLKLPQFVPMGMATTTGPEQRQGVRLLSRSLWSPAAKARYWGQAYSLGT